MNGSREVMVEAFAEGSGYDIQRRAFTRLGPEAQASFDVLDTSGKIRAWIAQHAEQLKPAELKEFNGYADYIGLLFGFQDEIPIAPAAAG